MLSGFCYQVYLPSIGEFERFAELNNMELLNILKFGANNDKVGMSMYLEHLIHNKRASDQSAELHRIDKICVLFTMLAVCIKPIVVMSVKCDVTGKDYNMDINILDLLNVISNIQYQSDSHQVTDQGNQFLMRFPRDIYTSLESLNVYDVIHTMTVDDVVYDVHNYTQDQRSQLVSKLPGSTVSRMLRVLKQYNSMYENVVYLSYKSTHTDDPTIHDHTVNLVNNELFNMFFTIINSDLKSFYETVHAMASNFNFSHEYYMKISPAEALTYYDMMVNDTQQKQSQEPSTIDNLIPGA